MNNARHEFLEHYVRALRTYVRTPNESSLRHAYELGREAVTDGLGVLDISTLHYNALRTVLLRAPAVDKDVHIEHATEFFVESLSAYEMVLRGFRESNADLKTANRSLVESRAANEALLAAYERSERISTRFQEAALPVSLPAITGFHFDAWYRPGPADSVLCGDWYDALRLADGRIVISIGDVGGSGLGAAVIMATIRQVIRGVAYIHPDPVMILDAAGKTLRSEHPDSYVSAFVGVIDPIEMNMTYASAGHPAPLLLLSDTRLQELSYEGVLLGIRAPEAPTPRQVTLSPGSRLILYTDGLIEATGDILDGETRLRRAVSDPDFRSSECPAQALHSAIIADNARDDIAILMIDVLPSNGAALAHGARVRRHQSWQFDAADAASAQSARADFSAQLRAAGAADEDVYAAEVVFGELIGNVLRHAGGIVDVLVDWEGPSPVLHVRDRGPGFTHAPRLPRNLWAESGRGLYIVQALTDDFNVTPIPEGGSHARAVLYLSGQQLSRPATPLAAGAFSSQIAR
jgi:serine phosphatase RsbU (regulator of sigma subunit)/anti-sigma regulatory factor (Ser/Thr protein kinase)